MKKLCTMMLFGAYLIIAADEPSEKTFGLDNGRFWNTLEPDCKRVFVLGMVHGWMLRTNTEETMKGKVLNAFTSSGNFTTNDLSDLITSIYADAENVGLPVGWVALASLAVQRGETNRNTVLTALRKQMSELLTGKASRPNTDYDPIDAIMTSRSK